MKLSPYINNTEHEIKITDHPSMFGFDVIIKFKQDSIYTGALKILHNVTDIRWMHYMPGYSSKIVTVDSFIHSFNHNYESYDVEYVIVEMATKLTTEG